jgi:hypothetical protein
MFSHNFLRKCNDFISFFTTLSKNKNWLWKLKLFSENFRFFVLRNFSVLYLLSTFTKPQYLRQGWCKILFSHKYSFLRKQKLSGKVRPFSLLFTFLEKENMPVRFNPKCTSFWTELHFWMDKPGQFFVVKEFLYTVFSCMLFGYFSCPRSWDSYINYNIF